MPNIKSAIKRNRQSQARRLRNRHHRTGMRNVIKEFIKTVESGDKEAAEKALAQAISKVDKTGKRRIVHQNTADRLKSRLTNRFNRAFNQ